jgi:uncharacterized protein YjdB
MNVSDTETLIATISPANASNQNVTWNTSDNTVADVVDGLVTAIGVGNCTITVETVDGNFTDTCAVDVS